MSLRLQVFVLSTAMFLQGCSSLAVLGMMREIGASFELPTAAGSALVGAYAMTACFTAPLIQFTIFRRLQYKAQAFSGLIVLAAGLIMSAFSDTYEVLIAGRAVTGMGAAIIGPSSAAYAALVAQPDQRARVYSRVFAGFTIAPIIGVPVASLVSLGGNWRVVFGLLAILALANAAAVYLTLGSTNAATPGSTPVSASEVARIGTVLATTMLQVASRFMPFTFLSALLVDHFGLDRILLPIALVAFGVGGLLGNMIGGWLGDRIGYSATVLGSMAVLAPIIAVLVLPLAGWTAVCISTLASVAASVFAPPQQALLLTHFHKSRYGMSAALNTMSQTLGMALGSVAGGLLQSWYGFDMVFFVSLGCLFLAIVAAFTSSFHKPKA